jgi:hypothetical protein
MMTLPAALNDREYQKFIDGAEGPTVRVALSGGLAPERYDRVDVTYPTATTEVYDFKLSGDTVALITLTYATSTKERLTSAVRT